VALPLLQAGFRTVPFTVALGGIEEAIEGRP